ncbi:hypothetical protein G9A89_019101 [Geosiphon pyriformis]|nr:hypothetical protein G9A89_019101 [Geosiphon pyriformis]
MVVVGYPCDFDRYYYLDLHLLCKAKNHFCDQAISQLLLLIFISNDDNQAIPIYVNFTLLNRSKQPNNNLPQNVVMQAFINRRWLNNDRFRVIRETSKQNTSSNDKEKDYGVKLKEVESKLKDYKLKQQADDVPDIEYCPHHEELPFEPSEDLNVDVDIFRHGPSSDAYEFANITPIEHPMPEIDEVDTKSIDHFIIPEAECYSFNNYQPSELSFEVVFDEIFGPLPPIGQMWTEEISI